MAGVWLRLYGQLRSLCRRRAGRFTHPTAAIIDSQSAKTTDRGGVHGYDGSKKINGRKRHLLVDNSGLVLCAQVHAANIADRDGARPLLEAAAAHFTKLKHLWADAGYRGRLVAWIKEHRGWSVDLVADAEGAGDPSDAHAILISRYDLVLEWLVVACALRLEDERAPALQALGPLRPVLGMTVLADLLTAAPGASVNDGGREHPQTSTLIRSLATVRFSPPIKVISLPSKRRLQ